MSVEHAGDAGTGPQPPRRSRLLLPLHKRVDFHSVRSQSVRVVWHALSLRRAWSNLTPTQQLGNVRLWASLRYDHSHPAAEVSEHWRAEFSPPGAAARALTSSAEFDEDVQALLAQSCQQKWHAAGSVAGNRMPQTSRVHVNAPKWRRCYYSWRIGMHPTWLAEAVARLIDQLVPRLAKPK